MSRIRVLYAEDELNLGKIVRETLEERGFEVLLEHSGAGVMKAFREGQPDICILDVMLPHRSGFDLARDIRQLDSTMPIIFLTAKTQTEDVIRGFRSGGNDYIRKPFSVEELILRMENLLHTRPALASRQFPKEEVRIGQFCFNGERQMLANGQQVRKLSYRESELLKYLWLNRVNIIPRNELLKFIWGNDSFFNSRNLDVYVTRLRGYLREDPAIEILTIKGVGYRFIAG